LFIVFLTKRLTRYPSRQYIGFVFTRYLWGTQTSWPYCLWQ